MQSTLTARADVDRERLRRFITDLYRRGKLTGEEGREFPLAPVGILEEDGEKLRDLAVREGAVHTFETGFAYGLSALFLCEAVAASGRADARHVSIDPMQKKLFDNAGLAAVRASGAGPCFEFLCEGSQTALPRFVLEGRRFDLAFLDGDHKFEAIFLDLYYAHRLVRPGGAILVDDIWMPSVDRAVRYFERNLGTTRTPWPAAPRWPLVRRALRMAPVRMALLRRPETPDQRAWDHFVGF
jgi:predicted O-methyltransferase YrrM